MERSKNVILFNTTDIVDNNPGCRATIRGLLQAINTLPALQIPLGFGYSFFKKSSFFSNDKFSYCFKKLEKSESVKQLIRFSDYIIINAEGTIHSNNIGAMTLLGFAKLGKKLGKKVYIVNGSYFNLERELLNILGSCDKVFSRDVLSFEYLKENNVDSELVFDCAFLSDHLSTKKKNIRVK